MKEVDIYSNIEDAVKMVVANKVDLVRLFWGGGHKAGLRQLSLYLQNLSTHGTPTCVINGCNRQSRVPARVLAVSYMSGPHRSWRGRCNC